MLVLRSIGHPQMDISQALSQALTGWILSTGIDEKSRHLVDINIHRGLFHYIQVAFGITSASAIFQREIDKVLEEVKRVSKYLDDYWQPIKMEKNIY